MLTALSEERDLIRGHLQGAVRYVTKPFEMRTLISTVDDALEPPDEAELQDRRDRTRKLLQRLAELDSGARAKVHASTSPGSSGTARPRVPRMTRPTSTPRSWRS